jgi:hypothetical protein
VTVEDLMDDPHPDYKYTDPHLGDDSLLLRKWAEFHGEHPDVYFALEKLALEWVNKRKRKHGGIAMFWETLRYFSDMGAKDEEYRLSNNHRAYYARLLLHDHRILRGVLSVRELRTRVTEES